MPLKQEEDFASAVMMRLIAMGMEKQGLASPVDAVRGARVARGSKRSALNQVAEQHGLLTILRLADAVYDMPPEPVAVALTKAAGLDDFLERWRRVESFSHASNRLRAEPIGETGFRLHHVSKNASSPPVLVESLLVIAVVTVLAEIASDQALRLETDRGQVLRDASTWRAFDTIDWSGKVHLIQTRRQVRDLPVPGSGTADIGETLKTIVAQDLVRRWSVQSLADRIGTSKRSLQRRLTEKGLSVSRLIMEVRLEAAAAFLCNADGPGLGAIGFLTGFADQAHFSRAFNAHVGIPPQDYRKRFGR